jgi:hypothetical protein
MKITAKLELTVVYDDGGYDDFDPDATLRYVVEHAAGNGLLTPDDGPVTVDTYEVKVSTTEGPAEQQATVRLPAWKIAVLNELLRGKRHACGEVIHVSTAYFDDGCFADLKLVNGDPLPYVAPVLFDREGREIAAGAPDAETFEGTYRWTAGVSEYRATVIACDTTEETP